MLLRPQAESGENARVAAILGGVGAALCWGTSTFFSSRSTRMIGSASVLAWVMLVGFVVVAPFAAVRGVTGNADGADIAWLAVASIGSVGGLGMSYAALRRGKVSIVAPICATEGAIAAIVAVAFGQQLAAATLVALAVIACGVILASTGNEVVEGHSSRSSIALAILAASLFGVSLYASGRVGPSLGAAAILLGARGLGVTVIALPLIVQRRLRLTRACAALRARLGRPRGRGLRRLHRRRGQRQRGGAGGALEPLRGRRRRPGIRPAR